MKETDCRKCCVSAFKYDLCKEDFCEKYYSEGSAEDFEKLLPHWIPCSERLPEDGERVLATTAWEDVTIAERIYPITIEVKEKRARTKCKTGRWIGRCIEGVPYRVCSECGATMYPYEPYEANFCPNCGADMRGVNND